MFNRLADVYRNFLRAYRVRDLSLCVSGSVCMYARVGIRARVRVDVSNEW